MYNSKLITLTLLSTVLIAVTQSGTRVAHSDSDNPPIVLESQKIELPQGNLKFEGSEHGVRAANTYCVMCHSRSMIDYQPSLSREAWKSEIHKMRTAYGCPVSGGLDEELVDFLYQYNHKPTRGASQQ